MSNKQCWTVDQSPNNFQEVEFQDIHSRDGVTTESTTSYRETEDKSIISESEQELIDGLEILKVDDVNKFSKKLQRSEPYMEEETQNFIQMLEQLKGLTLLRDEITKLEYTPSTGHSSNTTRLHGLQQELIDGVEKLKIDDLEKLTEKMQRLEPYIEEDTEDAKQILNKLRHLALLFRSFKKSKSTGSVDGTCSGMKSIWLEQESEAPSKRCLTSTGHEVQSNDSSVKSGSNKRSNSSDAFDLSSKRGREASASTSQFFVPLPAVKPICNKALGSTIRQKFRTLCEWLRPGFPGCHAVRMHRENYEMILQSPYMVSWKPVGKRYMMLIEGEDQVYMLDQGDYVFEVDYIQFPCDEEYEGHLKDTLVDGEFVIDNIDGQDKPSFWISDIITCNGQNVSRKPFLDRLRLICKSIVDIRNSAIIKGHIKETTQPFSIRSKSFFDLSKVKELLNQKFLATIPHGVEGLIFLPEKDPYKHGECQGVLKWKENETIEFLLKIVVDLSKTGALPEKQAHLFLNRMKSRFATMPYSSNLEKYDNKIISCLWEDDKWKLHRVRDDRPYPNSIQTAEDVMDAVTKPVTREALCDLIQKHHRTRRH